MSTTLFFALALAVPTDTGWHRVAVREVHLGVEVRITAWAPNEPAARTALRAAFAEIVRLEDLLSDWRPTSEVRRLERSPHIWQDVSPELCTVLALALEVARVSEGAFDPTLGPLTALWRVARASGRPPPEPDIAAARRAVGLHLVQVDTARRQVRLGAGEMRLDLGGIAKGFILQRAVEVMFAHGLRRVLIEGGGDIVAGDPPPGREGWTVLTPLAGPDMTRAAAALRNAALSTSGPVEQALDAGGARYSHILDPATGWGITAPSIATVMGSNAAVVDAVATALTVVPPALVQRLLAHFGLHGERRDPVGPE